MEYHYVVRWRSMKTGAVGNGRHFHDRDTAELWARMGDKDHPLISHWVVDQGPCDCPDSAPSPSRPESAEVLT